jgi:hypothetical protein
MFTDFEAALTRAETRVERFIQDPVAAAWDLVKKIIVYTLLMKRGYREPGFFQHLMTAPWFGDTIDAFFHGEYDRVYRDAIRDLLTKGVVERSEGRLITSVAP